jgi:hypothetical protein
MAERTFPAWVEPLAQVLAADRGEVIAFAREAPADCWVRPSVVEGWTNKQILAHLAGGNDQIVQVMLRAVTRGEALDPHLFDVDTDAENAARIAARQSWSIDALIGELARDGEEIQELLSRLSDEDRERAAGPGLTVGKFLRIVEHERHDKLHLEQLRAGSDQDR